MVAGIAFPLSLVKTIGGFRYISALSVISIFYLIFVLTINLPDYVHYYYDDPSLSVRIFQLDSNFLNAVGVTYFAYTNQSQLLPIYKELFNPIRRRVKKVYFSGDILITSIYLVLVLTGYLSTL
mmetsp:Transcript_26495/g.19850  ORF Transcript_26495/g.19850 Transcript_26495/m.19850 type:complete len:124 (-) Transcript_26495:88-459(-)